MKQRQQSVQNISHTGKQNKKNPPKPIVPIMYGQHIYIKNISMNQRQSKYQALWGRGFVDKNIYLTQKEERVCSEFTIEPKKGLYGIEGKMTTPVVFGAEVLIKHVVSQNYIAIKQQDQIPTLQFHDKQSSSCYFQFVPLRTFQSNGNIITTDSIFLILHSQRKLYITDLEGIESLPTEPASPNNLSKRITKEQSVLGLSSSLTLGDARTFGSISVIGYENQAEREKEKEKEKQREKERERERQKQRQRQRQKQREKDRDRDQLNIQISGWRRKNDAKQVNVLDISFSKEDDIKMKKVISEEFNNAQPQNNQKQKQKQRQKQKQERQHSKIRQSHSQPKKQPPFKNPLTRPSSIMNQSKKQSSHDNLSAIVPLLRNLPVYKVQQDARYCGLQNYSYSQWKFQHVKTELKTQYLDNHDYIYLTHSQANQIMILDIEKNPPEIAFVKNTNQGQNEYVLQSIFIVEIQKKNNVKLVYLKHLLSGSYFPLKANGQKAVCELIPLLSPKKNQFPPFKIILGGQVLSKNVKQVDKQKQKQNLHGFWLNKINKRQIAQIMSIQNVPRTTVIKYLKEYLKENPRPRQKILRQFFFIPYLIKSLVQLQTIYRREKNLTKSQKHELNIKEYYQLLFYICKNNEKNKKQCLRYIEHILRNPEKQQILDLLTELLIDNPNLYTIQKSITVNVIQQQIRQFIKYEGYSISFMRIFRVFCGSDQQPSTRNQCLLFNLFFWGAPVQDNNMMSQSVISAQKKTVLPSRFKFRIFQHEGNIHLSNGDQEGKYQDMKIDIIAYLRQYIYLLSDCMNGNNYNLIKCFTSVVKFSLLLKLLQKQQMKGPVLSIIYNAYLKPQKKYKPHIFHKDYQKICEKGSLISYCDEEQSRLRAFIDRQIRESKQYRSTMYRLLLNVFKMTIQGGYWRRFEDLVDLIGYLDGVIIENQEEDAYHSTYEEKSQDRNLLKSKITAISIKISLIDMQVSLWASDFVSGIYQQNQIQQKITQQIKHNKNWQIDQKILRLCCTKSPQLLRKAILLLYKISNLYKLTNKTYEQASLQTRSTLQLEKLFSTLQLKQEMKMIDYFCIIQTCLKESITVEELLPSELENNFRNLESMLGYRQVNEEVQNIAYKLGLHQALILDIKRYLTMIKKQKQQQSDILYWKLLTLYSLIRNNLKLRDLISQHRKLFIPLLESESPHYYIAVDLIEQVYRNNRKLIISDNEELKSLCKSIDFVFHQSGQVGAVRIDLRCCKVVNLLGVFVETGNRKIVENHQIILQYVFTKKFFTSSIISGMKDKTKEDKDKDKQKEKQIILKKESVEPCYNKEQYFKNVLQIVVYDLLVTMGQKKLLTYFHRPNNQAIHTLLLGIGTSNWSLKSKAFLSINYSTLYQQLIIHFIRLILYDLNIMCESLKNLDNLLKQQYMQSMLATSAPLPSSLPTSHSPHMPKQVKIYISNISKVIHTITHLFRACQKKLEKTQCEEEVLVIKIIQRLFILKRFCPEIVHEGINGLLVFVDKIELKKKRQNLTDWQIKSLLQKIDIGDFQKNQIKQKIPLIYGQKLKTKNTHPQKQKQPLQDLYQRKIHMSHLNQNTFQMTQNIIKQLKTLIESLSYVNRTDSTVLSDNIKEFLLNFLRTSFLEVERNGGGQDGDGEGQGQEGNQMQDILVQYQAPDIVCSILQQSFKHRYKLFCSAFDLGIKLLQGGHSKCQQKFLQKFRLDNKNWIFQNIYTIIFESLTTIEFYYHYKQDPTIKSYETLLQIEEYYTCREERKHACELLAKAFRFLQLLCENDNHVMKDYIYNQLDKQDHIKYMSKNFVQVAQRILDGVFKIIEFNIDQLNKLPNQKFSNQVQKNIYNLPIYILDFLIEVCQIPAQQNQLYLCRTDFLEFPGKLIKRREKIMKFGGGGGSGEEDWGIFFIYERKLVMLLKSLLQQNSSQIQVLMRKKIGVEEFQFFIEDSFRYGGLQDTQKLKQMLNQMQLNHYVQNIVNILIIKKILKIDTTLNFPPQKLKIITQLNNRIQSIHVDFKTHSLTVYFPSHQLFDLLSKKTKDFVLDRSANLTTRREKLTEFMISREVVYQDINNEKDSEMRFMNQEKMEYLFNFGLFLCYLILYLLIMFYSVSKSGAVLDIFQRQIIKGLSYMQLLVSIIYLILVGLNTYPIAKQKIKTHLTLKQRQNPKSHPTRLSQYLNTIRIIYIDEPESTNSVILLVISIWACLFEVRVYSFTLIFVFGKIELLQSILRSIRLTWKQLVFVCLLALAFSFIFGFITLNYYIVALYENQEIDISTDMRGAKHCNSIFTCVSSLYTQKIIGQSVTRNDEQYNYGRFISDVTYWGFFQVLLSNIIAAIIIDKFAEQRNAKQKVQHQRYSKCYICFADRSTLERRGQDFISHVTHVHNLWNYFFYMYTLENLKDITDFTGIEYWINRQVKQNQIDWIPIDASFKDQDVSMRDIVNAIRPMLVEREVEEK